VPCFDVGFSEIYLLLRVVFGDVFLRVGDGVASMHMQTLFPFLNAGIFLCRNAAEDDDPSLVCAAASQ